MTDADPFLDAVEDRDAYVRDADWVICGERFSTGCYCARPRAHDPEISISNREHRCSCGGSWKGTAPRATVLSFPLLEPDEWRSVLASLGEEHANVD